LTPPVFEFVLVLRFIKAMVVPNHPRPLKNAQFWLRSRKAIILTGGIYWIFWGL